jgi:hypothetical protein
VKNKEARISGLGPENPGREVVAIDHEPGMGSVSVYAAHSKRNVGAIVRLSLFGEIAGNRQLMAAAFLPEGFAGEVFAVSGHLVDSWHVLAGATKTQADLSVTIMGLECCGPPKIWAPAELLALPLQDDAPDLPIGFLDTPIVPAGDDFGAAGALAGVGTQSLNFPPGARLTHWLAESSSPGGSLAFTDASGLVRTLPLVTGKTYEGFPNGRWPVASVGITNLAFSLFEFVV